MTVLEFQRWPKTPRLNQDMIITEKIDGTNGAVVVRKAPEGSPYTGSVEHYVGCFDGEAYFVGAQSRNRLLPMGPRGMDDVSWRKQDNAGFAQWVRENSEALALTLGEGYHYGEWYGAKIGRKYGLDHRRFALFNVGRYGPLDLEAVPGLETVPVLYQGQFSTEDALEIYEELMVTGSRAVPGWDKPEGIIVYHCGSKQVYKVTDQGDKPKWQLQAVAA
ncbi:RNA ligase family protein [Actinomadura sp. NPDC048021]|uniref:RNA ligase family protein n=1 Tax=Actinomadura sp. NPDC048021 TaxID=3155385 RepID=UPI0033DB9426